MAMGVNSCGSTPEQICGGLGGVAMCRRHNRMDLLRGNRHFRLGRVGSRRGPDFELCRRFLDPPYHSVRRVFPSTAGRRAYQARPCRNINQLKPAPGMRWLTTSLSSPFVHRVVTTVVPLCVGPRTR